MSNANLANLQICSSVVTSAKSCAYHFLPSGSPFGAMDMHSLQRPLNIHTPTETISMYPVSQVIVCYFFGFLYSYFLLRQLDLLLSQVL